MSDESALGTTSLPGLRHVGVFDLPVGQVRPSLMRHFTAGDVP